jgi:hypothetical protein
VNELHDLMHRYATAIDGRRLELLRDVFTPDGVEEFQRLGATIEGVDGIIEFIGNAIGGWQSTMHTITNIVSDGETCSCFYVAYHVGPDGLFEVGGAYYDKLVRTDAGLRIAERVNEAFWTR